MPKDKSETFRPIDWILALDPALSTHFALHRDGRCIQFVIVDGEPKEVPVILPPSGPECY